MKEAMEACLMLLSIFGGVSLLIRTSMQAKIAHLRELRESSRSPQTAAPQGDTVLAELKSLRQQMAEMQNTSHQFDLSFDQALTRLEQRVSHVEARTGTSGRTAPATEEAAQQVIRR